MATIKTCDLCSYATKNIYLFKRHRQRCKKEHGITRGRKKKAPAALDGSMEYETEPSLSHSILDVDELDGSVQEGDPSVPEVVDPSDCDPIEVNMDGSMTTDTESSAKPKQPKSFSYDCTKCSFQTRKSRDFLYHHVQEHESRMSIYACTKCDYCSQYRQKLRRHMGTAHGLDVDTADVVAEHKGASNQTLPITKVPKNPASKAPRSPSKRQAMSKHSGRKLMVKFGRPQPTEGSKQVAVRSSAPEGAAPQQKDQLSRVVEEIVGNNGETKFKCKECQFTSDDKQQVAKHAVSWHVDTKSFSCSYCEYITFEKSDLAAHNITHRNEQKFKCDDCTYSTDFRPNFDRHLQSHKGLYPFKCTICTYSCGSEAALRRHVNNHHDSVSPKSKKIKLHVPVPKQVSPPSKRSVSNTDIPPQPIDGSSGKESQHVNLETARKPKAKIFFDSSSPSMVPRPSLPPISDETAKSIERGLSPGRKLPSNITKFVEKLNDKLVCPMCQLKYLRTSDLNRHMKGKHGIKLRDYLEKIGKNPADFEGLNESEDGVADDSYEDMDHDGDVAAEDENDDEILKMLDHQNESMDDNSVPPEQLKCKFCDYQAKWTSDLKRHYQSHSVEKRFKCNYCPKKYKFRSDLNVHIRRDHKCEPSKDVKVVKVATVGKRKTAPAIFKCPCCNYTSAWKSEIDRHSRLHNADKTYQCKNCEYQTYWRSDIRRHLYKKHPEIMIADVAINDVVNILKDRAPEIVSKAKAKADYTEGIKSEDKVSSRETSPTKTVNVHEGSMGVNMGELELKSSTAHSPTPSPIKDMGNGIFECQYCGFAANAPSKMNAHIATHTNLKRYMCPTCGRRANWKWDIAKHIRVAHNDQVTKVIKLGKKEAEDTIQSYMEANPVVRRDHHLNVTPDKEIESKSSAAYFKCSLCSFSDERRISVNRHMLMTHPASKGSILLVLPDKKGILEANASEFQPVAKNTEGIEAASDHDAAKPFMCSECGKRAASKGDVKKHYHYAHAEKEIRIVYLGDGSQSVYAAKPAAQGSKAVVESPPPITPPPPPPPPPSIENQQVSPSSTYMNPKVVGYIKPYKCGLCGRRSNWRWDMNRHIRERHPLRRHEIEIIELPEDVARATIAEYCEKELPILNKSSDFVYKKRGRKRDSSHLPLQDKTDVKVHVSSSDLTTSQAIAPPTISSPSKTEITTTSKEPALPSHPARTVHENIQLPSPIHPLHAGVRSRQFKKYKCSGCHYRSNFSSDVSRHLARKHGVSQAKVVVLDQDTALKTLATYSYNKNEVQKDVPEGEEKEYVQARLMSTPVKAPDGPLPKSAWAGLEKKVWMCSLCTFSDVNKVEVLKHLGKHNMKAYKCTACNWSSNFKSAVFRHIQGKHNKDDGAQAKLCIKLVKEGPGLDDAGMFILPGGLVSGPTQSNAMDGTVPVTGQESLQNPSAMMSHAVYFCKICNHSSTWRSCICRHIKKTHKMKEYRSNIVKKIIRTSRPSTVVMGDGNRDVDGYQSQDDSHVWKRPKNFKCQICPYKTYKGKMLKFHMTCHQPQPGVNQVQCKYCPYFVSSNRLLTQHLYLHMQEMKSCGETAYPVTPVKKVSTSSCQSPQNKSSGKSSTTPSDSKSPQACKRHRCELCPYSTNSKNDFLYHKQFHRPKPTADFKCNYCDYWVSHRRLLKQHLKVHEEGYSHELSEMELTPAKSDYSENSLVYDTVEIAAIKQRIISSKITASISQSPLISPMKIASRCSMGGKRGFFRKDGTYRKIHHCRFCPYMNMRPRNMRLHELMHGKRNTGQTLVKCPHCDYHVSSRSLLGHHLRVHRPDYGSDFLEHGNKFDQSDSFASEDSEIDSSISLEKKIDTLLEITRFKKYGCEKCPYSSAKRSRFQRHVELHGSKQKYKCDFCDYSVPTMNLLTQHTKLHFEPNQNLLAAQSILNLQYLPEMPADVALASMMTRNDAKNPVSITHDHIDLYENQTEDLEPKKLYRCDRCPYANVRRDYLLAHLRCHMVKNEFACPYCDYSVGKTHVLLQHVKVHFSPLPELSEWLAENGNTERLKEIKNKDLEEVIEVVKLFQGEKKNENGLKESQNINVKAGQELDIVHKNVAKPLENVMGQMKMPVVKAGPSTTYSTIDQHAIVKNDVTEQPTGTAMEIDAVIANTDADKTPENDKENQKGEDEAYICQYCDREFPTSDSLVRHEVKHLIGNSYEELVSHLPQILETSQCTEVNTRNQSAEGQKENEAAGAAEVNPADSQSNGHQNMEL
ncbi:uncharacterized protein LOC127846484 [Dreissena polymorpha]|uniref:C2H2-type domain-containing protein n=1 Tax=Dreissena polymorpha TaxID=45954 RepID=A0A9D4E6I6_DREPO|nr:uncharacterized protein LOC127846484 [Dreissena polymorpha]KAH3773201.1 hypothetical protein DPMN_174558 [Dreissena polymorpha]